MSIMSEEIEWLDEELTNLTAELTEQLKELTSRTGKKLSKGNRDDKVLRPASIRIWQTERRGCRSVCPF